MDKLQKNCEHEKFEKINLIETDYKKKLDTMKQAIIEKDDKIVHLSQDNKLLISQLQLTERNLEDLRLNKKETE
jgi:hypothetical protein